MPTKYNKKTNRTMSRSTRKSKSKTMSKPTLSSIRPLVTNKADKIDRHGNTVFHNFCKINFYDVDLEEYNMVKQVLMENMEESGENINAQNKKGETPLDLLCIQYNKKIHNLSFDDKQSLLSVIMDLQSDYGAELNKCIMI
jgi:hypothetical protein